MSQKAQTMELAASYLAAVKRSKSQTAQSSLLTMKLDPELAASLTLLFEEWTMWDKTAYRAARGENVGFSIAQVCEWRSEVERKLDKMGIHLQGSTRTSGLYEGE